MREVVQELIPLLALFFEREDRDKDREHLQMEDEVEEVLSRSLLSCDLKVALLEALEIIDTVVRQEVKTELDAFHFLDDELDDLQRVALLVNLLNDFRLFNQDRVDELYQLVFESEAFLTKFTMEHSSIVNVKLLLTLEIQCFFLHSHIRLGLCLRGAFHTSSCSLLTPNLAKA